MKLRSFGIRLRLMLKKLIIDVRHTHLRDLRNVTLSNIKKIPDVLHLRNLVVFSSILAFVVLALFVQRFNVLEKYYVKLLPDFGGNYSQGVVGNVDSINPLFASNDAEKAASKLVFSGLTRTINGTDYIPDLAQSWTAADSNRTYVFTLKKNLKWQDGQPLTVDDVIFTYSLIQNPDTRTALNQVWRGVTVTKVGDNQVKFVLPNAFPEFLDVTSQGILPQHLLSGVNPKNVKAAEFNDSPIGSGPYKFERFDQLGAQKEVIFSRNNYYATHKPYIDQVRLVMYENEASLFAGLSHRQIDGVLDVAPKDKNQVRNISNVVLYRAYLPDYQVLYLNLRNDILKNKDIRAAIASAINRDELIQKVMLGEATAQYSAILPGRPGYDSNMKEPAFDLNAANASLEKAGFLMNKNGYRAKDGKTLELKLVLPSSFESNKDAEYLKAQLNGIGVKVTTNSVDVNEINSNYIRPRNFDMLLITQNVGLYQDLYSFWHSSQVNDPGLNLSGFSDKKVDKLVEQVRKSTDEKYRADRYKEINASIVGEVPVVFLYRPVHYYVVTDQILGVEQKRLSEPVDMLNNIADWYIKVKKSY